MKKGGEELVLQWNERTSKTRDMREEVCKFPPTLYPNHADRARCPVQAYLLYKENRPASMMGDDTPFYLCVNHIDHPQAPWFKAQAV